MLVRSGFPVPGFAAAGGVGSSPGAGLYQCLCWVTAGFVGWDWGCLCRVWCRLRRAFTRRLGVGGMVTGCGAAAGGLWVGPMVFVPGVVSLPRAVCAMNLLLFVSLVVGGLMAGGVHRFGCRCVHRDGGRVVVGRRSLQGNRCVHRLAFRDGNLDRELLMVRPFTGGPA